MNAFVVTESKLTKERIRSASGRSSRASEHVGPVGKPAILLFFSAMLVTGEE